MGIKNNTYNKVILVTGCCGTTGTRLMEILDNKEERDTFIIGVDNFYKDGSKSNRDKILSITSARVRIYEEDISNESFYTLIKRFKIDEVYNLAAVVETPRFYDSPYLTYIINCESAIKLYKWCSDNGVKKFINCSSSEIYGIISEYPTKEITKVTYHSRDITTRWSYAMGKYLTEYVMNNIYDNNKVTKVAHLRYANTYGEYDTAPVHIIPYILTSLINKDEEIVLSKDYELLSRSFLHDDDSATATYVVMNTMDKSGESYNIGSDELITIKDLFEKCVEVCEDNNIEINKDIKIKNELVRVGDPLKRILDTSKISELGFITRIPLEEGILRVAKAIVDRKDN